MIFNQEYTAAPAAGATIEFFITYDSLLVITANNASLVVDV
jgi:hypothetical protein